MSALSRSRFGFTCNVPQVFALCIMAIVGWLGATASGQVNPGATAGQGGAPPDRTGATSPSVAAEVVGTWEAPAVVDDAKVKNWLSKLAVPPLPDMLDATEKSLLNRYGPAYVRLTLNADGTMKWVAVDIDLQVSSGTWSAQAVSAASVHLRASRDSLALIERDLSLSDSGFTMSAPDDLMVKSPLVFKRVPADRLALEPASARPIGTIKDPVHDLVHGWVKEHNSFGPNHAIADDMTGLVDKHVAAGEDCFITLGAGLLKSGHATRLAVVGKRFFSLELTDRQARQLKLENRTVAEQGIRPKGVEGQRWHVELGEPVFRTPMPFRPGREITGMVTMRAVHDTDRNGEFVLRLRYGAGQTIYHRFHDGPSRLNGTWNFSFTLPADGPLPAGPLVGFVDMCQASISEDGVEQLVALSNAVAFVADVAPAAGQ